MTVPAVILAGGNAKPEFVAATGLSNRALIPVNGKTILACVADALRGAPQIGAIRVVGDLPAADGYEAVADHGGFVENLFAGIAGWGDHALVLIATADLPFLTPESVEDLVARGSQMEADMVYPVIRVSDCYDRFPGIKRTAVKLREGEFTGGNLVLARPGFLAANRDRIATSYAMRKQPIRIAMMLGPATLLRFALTMAGWPGLLTIQRLEQTGSRLVGGTVRALISPYPEIATDIDKPADLAAMESTQAQ